MRPKFKKRHGLTLVELLIYLAITMIVLVVVIDLVTRIGQNRNQSAGQGDVSANARFLSERLSYAIQSSSAINGSYPADTLNLTNNGQPIIFSLNEGQIFYQEAGSPATAITSDQVEISPINPGENIFNKVTNLPAQSIQSVRVRFKAKYKQTGFSRDFETAVLAKGK